MKTMTLTMILTAQDDFKPEHVDELKRVVTDGSMVKEWKDDFTKDGLIDMEITFEEKQL